MIDCDPGVDDAVTLAVAARSPEFDLALVTTATGNVPVAQGTANALALLHHVGRDDVPVAAGAARGLVIRKPIHRAVHGPNGLGGVTLGPATRAPERDHAVVALARLLAGSPARSVTIVAIAPLTNLALLLGVAPELADRVARVVVMGGSSAEGNVTPHAEYNAWADPEAAARVLTGGELPIVLVPLPVTRRATLGSRTAAALRAGSPLGAQLSAMIDGYGSGPVAQRALHDLVALAAVLDPTLLATRPATVEVDTAQGPTRGATEIDLATGVRAAAATAPVRVAVDLDVDRLRELLLGRIAGP